MHIYVTENNRLSGIQNIGGWPVQELKQLITAIESQGKKWIKSDLGITICEHCQKILKNKKGCMPGDGLIAYDECIACHSK